MSSGKTSIKNIELALEVIFFQEGDYIVAFCPALELSSYGTDQKDAEFGFQKAVSIFLEETNRRGTLEKELLRLGWILQLKPIMKYKPPVLKVSESKIPVILHTAKMPILLPAC